MTPFRTLLRVLDAALSALGVVFGLVPDPTRVPVPIPVHIDPNRRS